MLLENLARALENLAPDARVLDVGAWAAPVNRATHVLDLMPYETRCALRPGYGPPEEEQFSDQTWLIRDMCDRDPWPYPDDYFDLSICVTTLEDVRDPVGVCRELSRVAKAGYIEVPRLWSELIWHPRGEWGFVGHHHHRWFSHIDQESSTITFTHKPHSIHGDPRVRIPEAVGNALPVEDRLQGLLWEGEFTAQENVVIGPHDLDPYAQAVADKFGADTVAGWARDGSVGRPPQPGRLARVLGRG